MSVPAAEAGDGSLDWAGVAVPHQAGDGYEVALTLIDGPFLREVLERVAVAVGASAGLGVDRLEDLRRIAGAVARLARSHGAGAVDVRLAADGAGVLLTAGAFPNGAGSALAAGAALGLPGPADGVEFPDGEPGPRLAFRVCAREAG